MGILSAASFVARDFDGLAAAGRVNATKFAETFGSAATRGLGSPSRSQLLTLYRTNAWVRLAADVVAAHYSAASWYLVMPANRRRRGTARRLQATKGWNREAFLRKAVDAGDLVEIDDHPFLTMLARGTVGAAPQGLELSGNEADMVERKTLDLLGLAFYVLIRDPSLGIPVTWWPVPPPWLRMPQKGRPYFELTRAGGYRIPIRDVVTFREPRPDDPYGDGAGIAEALADEVEWDESAAQYSAALIRHHARPDVLIMAPGLGTAEQERFESKWRDALSGPSRAGMAHFLGYNAPMNGRAGVTVHDLSHSPSDLDMVAASQAVRDKILQVWRVPPDVVGVTENSNRATAHEAQRALRENRIIPDLERRRDLLQWRFFGERSGESPEFEGDFTLAYRLPKLEDPAAAELVKALPYAFPHNAILRAAGREPVEGGDVRYFVPDGVQVSNDLDNIPDRYGEI